MGDCYCRKLPLRVITTDPDILSRIESLVVNTNHMIRETYQFVRLYFLHLLKYNLPLPIIDRSFLKLVFSLISNRREGKMRTELKEFYLVHYSPLQTIKVQSVGKDILDYEIISIITNIENHVKGSFFTYVNNLVYSICSDDKKQNSKVRNDLYDSTLLSEQKYHNDILLFSSDISNARKTLFKQPQLCLPVMYKIASFIEKKGGQSLSLLPLRRSLIPAYITIDKTIFYESFRDILNVKKDIWNNINKAIYGTLKTKETFSFTSLKTDGIACSIFFRTEKRGRNKEMIEEYFEDLKVYDEFKEKKIVAIDPNKGNLVYCFDGEKSLRYTQNERRNRTRKTKYKKIRKEKETDLIVRSSVDDDFHSVRSDLNTLSETNSRTTDFDAFKDYVSKKNDMSLRFCKELYNEPIFRKLKWNTHMNLKRSEDSFITRFKKTYGEKDVVIVFGDWEERPGFLRGKEPSKGKSLRKMFRQAGYQVFLLDEYRTSKLCCKCHSENEHSFITRPHPKPWKKEQSQKVWGLLRCTNGNCRRIHNRDWNSASNIRYIALSLIALGVRPDVFQRKAPQTCAT